ncbi:hypothetical protein C8R43DRAFT_964585 [Mycena crocata]|nr:hypothetical protein C8R43DRAFT_964585 [Mycena crocata]
MTFMRASRVLRGGNMVCAENASSLGSNEYRFERLSIICRCEEATLPFEYDRQRGGRGGGNLPLQHATSVSPITRLCRDTLGIIFETLHNDVVQGQNSPLRDVLRVKRRLAGVCTFFERVVMQTPQLWTYIAIHRGGVEWDNVVPTSLSTVQLHLRLSGCFPLHVCFADMRVRRDSTTADSGYILSLLVEQIHRIMCQIQRFLVSARYYPSIFSCGYLEPGKVAENFDVEDWRRSTVSACSYSMRITSLAVLACSPRRYPCTSQALSSNFLAQCPAVTFVQWRRNESAVGSSNHPALNVSMVSISNSATFPPIITPNLKSLVIQQAGFSGAALRVVRMMGTAAAVTGLQELDIGSSCFATNEIHALLDVLSGLQRLTVDVGTHCRAEIFNRLQRRVRAEYTSFSKRGPSFATIAIAGALTVGSIEESAWRELWRIAAKQKHGHLDFFETTRKIVVRGLPPLFAFGSQSSVDVKHLGEANLCGDSLLVVEPYADDPKLLAGFLSPAASAVNTRFAVIAFADEASAERLKRVGIVYHCR